MWLLVLFLLIPIYGHGYDRIISLSPQITESIYLVGAEDRLIGVTEFCKRPSEALEKEKVGTPLRPDIEKIVARRPDLVLGAREGNPPLVMARLERLGIPVTYFQRPRNLSDLLANFLTLSRLVGKEEKGKSLVRMVESTLPKPKGKLAFKVLWQVGADPLIAASQNSLANDIIRYAGGTNIIESELPYVRINAEEVMVKAPQVIVVMDHGYSVEREMNRWRSLLGKTRFVVMDAYAVGSPTPVSFVEAVNRLAGVVLEGENLVSGETISK